MDHAALERSSIPSIYSFALTSMSSRLWPPITPAPLGSMAGNKLGLPDVMPAVHLPLLSGFRQNMKKPRYRPVRCPFKNLGLICWQSTMLGRAALQRRLRRSQNGEGIKWNPTRECVRVSYSGIVSRRSLRATMRLSSLNKTTRSGLLTAARRWSLHAIVRFSSVPAFGRTAGDRGTAQAVARPKRQLGGWRSSAGSIRPGLARRRVRQDS